MMYLNAFADTTSPVDLTATAEFRSLVTSAADLGVPHTPSVRYVSRNVVANGLRFHLLEWGEPGLPALVLLHGGNQSAHSWDLVSLHFADRFHIIAIDQRGHGDSEWPRDGVAGPREMAADAAAILRQLGVERPIVAGHSMGGIVTLTLLRDEPALARSAILVDVAPETSHEGTAYIQSFITSLPEFESLEEFIDRVADYDPYRSREHIARTARYNLLRRADGKYVSKHDIGRRSAANSVDDFRRQGPSMDDAAAFALPVLVVRGADSTVLTEQLAERFVRALPRGRLATVTGCGHNVHSQNVLGFIDAVTPFMHE
jgi:pimeloyl-ACP methyl ester carboxylesterase